MSYTPPASKDPRQRDSSALRVARSLRQLVLSGEIEPGTRLSQARVAAVHDVSRIPVRDAFQMLAAEGLLDLAAPHAVVHPLSVEELQELYELREAVEPLATRLGVNNVGRAELSQMEDLAKQMEGESSPAAWIEMNAQFHGLVYRRAPRPRMIQLTDQLSRLTDRYLHLHLSVIGDTEHLHDEHRQIFEAVSRGDAESAAELTRLHLATSHKFILRYFLDSEGGSGDGDESK